MSSLKNIVTGHLNELVGENEALFIERYVVCNGCPEKKDSKVGEVCGLCGCRLQAKLRVEKERCALEKW